jgi:hypothetical protein
VDRRGKTDNQTIVNRNGDMMAMVGKKFRRKARVDGVVKEPCGDVRKNGFIARVQDLNFGSHGVAFPLPDVFVFQESGIQIIGNASVEVVGIQTLQDIGVLVVLLRSPRFRLR